MLAEAVATAPISIASAISDLQTVQTGVQTDDCANFC